MKVFDPCRAAQLLAKSIGKPILYLSGLEFGFAEGEEPQFENGKLKAAPFMDMNKDGCYHYGPSGEELEIPDPDMNVGQAIGDGLAFVICDSVEEMYELYGQVVGDDGPTKSNLYNGPHRVYALTIYADGTLGTENT
jgi:hypothetical protein